MIQLARFEFSRDHIHAGVRYAAGDSTDLPDSEAEMLRSLGAGSIVKTEVKGASPTPSPSERKRK